jgi:SAM-dependent methyltransferase
LAAYRRAGIPVRQNLPATTPDEAIAVPLGDLDLRVCPACGVVFNGAFHEDAVEYGARYDATQSSSRMFSDYLDGIVDKLIRSGVTDKNIVEIGCGKGDFIQRLCARGNNRAVGYDTSYVGPETVLDGSVRFVRSYYGEADLAEADIVLCRLVIAHVPRPVEFLRSLRRAFGRTGSRLLYLETPALEWILQHRVWWDIFYEHCSYFTQLGLRNTLRLAGFEPLTTERVFGGQYQWVSARLGADVSPVLEPVDPRQTTDAFAHLDSQALALWQDEIRARARQGGVAVWGAGAKGVTFANLVDPDAMSLSYVIDINPAKQGRFVPGTGHPIVGPEQLRRGDVHDVLLMNPNYIEESARILMGLGIHNTRLHRVHATPA